MDNNFDIKAQTLLKVKELHYEFKKNQSNWEKGFITTDELSRRNAERQKYLKKVIDIVQDESFVEELKLKIKNNYNKIRKLSKISKHSNLKIKYNEADKNIMPDLENVFLNGEMLRLLEEQDKLLDIATASKSFYLVELGNNPLQYFTMKYYKTKVVNQLDNKSLRIDIGDGPKCNEAKFAQLNLILEQKNKNNKGQERRTNDI